ncbi:MAG: hypothetical protein ACREBS_02475, partial [Nitrososphaerales archaeon]
MASDDPVKLADLTRTQDKVSDLDYPAIVIAIPSVAQDAREYANLSRMLVLEVANADEIVPRLDNLLSARQLVESPEKSSNVLT